MTNISPLNPLLNIAPPLATVIQEPLSRAASITLLGRRGAPFTVTHELLESGGPFTRALNFIFKIPPPSSSSSSLLLNEHGGTSGGGAYERFEWRHSSGVEVEALGGRHSGWKLVRMSSSSTAIGVSKGEQQKSSQQQSHTHHSIMKHGRNSDGDSSSNNEGKEVVAVWVMAGPFLARVLRFRFLASGADGSLGERWAVLAVASALAIWNRDRRARNRALGSVSF